MRMPMQSSKNFRVTQLRMPYPGSQYPARPSMTYGIKWNLEFVRDSIDPDILLFTWLIGVPPGVQQFGTGQYVKSPSLPNESNIEPSTPVCITDTQQQQQSQFNNISIMPIQNVIKIEPKSSEYFTAQEQSPFNLSIPLQKKIKVGPTAPPQIITKQSPPLNNRSAVLQEIKTEPIESSQFNSPDLFHQEFLISPATSSQLAVGAGQQSGGQNPVHLQKEIKIEPIIPAQQQFTTGQHPQVISSIYLRNEGEVVKQHITATQRAPYNMQPGWSPIPYNHYTRQTQMSYQSRKPTILVRDRPPANMSIPVSTFGSDVGNSVGPSQNRLEMNPLAKQVQAVPISGKTAQKLPLKPLKCLAPKAPIPLTRTSVGPPGNPPDLTQSQSQSNLIQEIVHTDPQSKPSVIKPIEQPRLQNVPLLLLHECPIVGCNEYFSSPQTIDMHFDMHIPEASNKTRSNKMVKCPTCWKSLRVNSLRRHNRRFHPSEEEATFRCAFCNKEFSSKSSLTQHVANHTGSRQYSCGKCAKGYNRKQDLDKHMQSHVREEALR